MMELDQNTASDLGSAPQRFEQVSAPSYLGSLEQTARALHYLGRMRSLVVWRALGGHWFVRGGQVFYRGLTEILVTPLCFGQYASWSGDCVIPSPRDVIEELSQRGFDIITSPTRIAAKPLRVVARRSDEPTVPPVEVADETLYLALLAALERVVRPPPQGERTRSPD